MSDLFSCLVTNSMTKADSATTNGRKLSYKYYKSPFPTTVRNGDLYLESTFILLVQLLKGVQFFVLYIIRGAE